MLGISHSTLYSQLANHKLDLLNLLLNLYNKKTNILTINSLADLIEYSPSAGPSSPLPPRRGGGKGGEHFGEGTGSKTNITPLSGEEKEIKSPKINTELSPSPPKGGGKGRGEPSPPLRERGEKREKQ